jgi:hypothetical protein
MDTLPVMRTRMFVFSRSWGSDMADGSVDVQDDVWKY